MNKSKNMAPSGGKRRRGEELPRRPAKKIKHFKKQKHYHSSSDESDDDVEDAAHDDGFAPVTMDDSEEETVPPAGNVAVAKTTVEVAPMDVTRDKPAVEVAPGEATQGKTAVEVTQQPSQSDNDSELDEDDIDIDIEDADLSDLPGLDDLSDASSLPDEDDDAATGTEKKKRKRNDPTAFANSISKILGSKLSTSKRSDPVLSRSAAASAASKEVTDAKLEARARRKLHAEKRQAMEKGRVRDVLGLDAATVSTADIQEQERRLKKTAQRGVVKLFNAVRAAQVKGEMAREEVRRAGVIGIDQREERVSELSKQGFLDLLKQGGKTAPALDVQEA